jgi:hypothetical protein
MKSFGRAVRLALLLAWSALAPPLRAAELAIAPPAVVDARIELTFQLEEAFDERLLARLDSGLPTGFTYRFVVLRDRKHWWDAKLEETTLEVIAMYNAVGNEYLVNFKQDGRMVESRLARSRGELEAAMSRFERVPLFAAEGLPRGERLLVKGRAELGTRTLFSFIPVDIETDWAESRKFRLP